LGYNVTADGVAMDERKTAFRVLSEREKFEVLKEIHDSPMGGHTGIIRTYRKFKQFIN
jgi:hypothetical protein